MSLDILEDTTPSGIRVRIALHILNDVVPRIMGGGNTTLIDRIAVAYSYYKLLCSIARCIEGIPEDPNKWGETTLKKIADNLIEYARHLLRNIL